jgi:hypothetical protein
MFGKYNGFVSKARVTACMYFLVYTANISIGDIKILLITRYCVHT